MLCIKDYYDFLLHINTALHLTTGTVHDKKTFKFTFLCIYLLLHSEAPSVLLHTVMVD